MDCTENLVVNLAGNLKDSVVAIITGLRDAAAGLWTAIKDKASELWNIILETIIKNRNRHQRQGSGKLFQKIEKMALRKKVSFNTWSCKKKGSRELLILLPVCLKKQFSGEKIL
mgnify:CR=1 FL=1